MADDKRWYENDNLWDDLAFAMFGPRALELAGPAVDNALDLLKVEPGSAILDLGCGVGRHAFELARRGFQVTGVDRNEAFLARARETADREELEVELVHEDMRAFHRRDAFDAAINLFTSFGYFEDPTDDLRVAGNLYVSLRPCGRLLMELLSKEVIARRFQPKDWREVGERRFILEERRVQPGWSCIETRWIFADDRGIRDYVSLIRLYSAAELTRLLRDAGFRSVEIYGSLSGKPYDVSAERLVAIAVK